MVVQLWFLHKLGGTCTFWAYDNSLEVVSVILTGMHESCTIKEKRQARTRVKEKKCSHRTLESICVIISVMESVTNLTGTASFWCIRGDVGVGGEMVRMIKSYRIAIIYRMLWQFIEKLTFTWTFAASNPPTSTSLRQQTSPSQSILVSRPQLDKSGGIGQIVPSPNIISFQELNSPNVTETCRSRFTWINGFGFFDLFLMAESSESAADVT